MNLVLHILSHGKRGNNNASDGMKHARVDRPTHRWKGVVLHRPEGDRRAFTAAPETVRAATPRTARSARHGFPRSVPAVSLARMGYTQVSPDVDPITLSSGYLSVLQGSQPDNRQGWDFFFAYEEADRLVATQHVPEEISTTAVSLKRIIAMRGGKYIRKIRSSGAV